MNRSVREVMTHPVVVAREGWSFKEIARRLRGAGVSALPVVDDRGRAVGIVSEADLLLKQSAPDEVHGFRARARGHRERRKAEALTARALMTSPVLTIGPDEPLRAAARTMHERGVKRLPVVDADGSVIGIVSRRDIVKVFVQPDREIRDEVVRDVIQGSLWLDPSEVHVDVVDGVVTLEGQVETRSLLDILVRLVHGVDGVVGVVSRLAYQHDDARVQPEAVLPWGVLPPTLQVPRPRR